MSRLRILKVVDSIAGGSTVDEVVRVLNSGGLVVAPTETRYGLLARADNNAAVEKLFAVKQRLDRMPTAIFIKSVDQISRFGRTTEIVDRLTAAFLPGPLTLVLKAVEGSCPSVVIDGRIGLRLSSHSLITAITGTAAFPITATSANLSGTTDLDTIDRISSVFGAKVKLYLDAGNLNGDVSTVVDCSTEMPVVLREGAITIAKIMAVAGVRVS